MRPGLVWMTAAVVFLASMAACVKGATQFVSVPQTLFFRVLVGLPIVLVLIKHQGVSLLGSRSKLLVVRSLFGLIALFLSFYAISKLPLGNVAVLLSTWPIFIALFSFRVTREKVSAKVFALLPFFLFGVAMVVKPTGSFLLLPSLASLLAACTIALARLYLRELRKTDHPLTIVFYFTAITIVLSLIPAILFWKPLTPTAIFYLVGAGLFGTGAQISLTKAYQLERASTVSLLGYLTMVFAFLYGILFFGERPDLASIGGAIVIVLCGYVSTRIREPQEQMIDNSEPKQIARSG